MLLSVQASDYGLDPGEPSTVCKGKHPSPSQVPNTWCLWCLKKKKQNCLWVFSICKLENRWNKKIKWKIIQNDSKEISTVNILYLPLKFLSWILFVSSPPYLTPTANPRPKLICWILTPKVIVVRGGAFQRWSAPKLMGLVLLMEQALQISLVPYTMWGHS